MAVRNLKQRNLKQHIVRGPKDHININEIRSIHPTFWFKAPDKEDSTNPTLQDPDVYVACGAPNYDFGCC